jgi:exodeoxyribonuclease VII large subunit
VPEYEALSADAAEFQHKLALYARRSLETERAKLDAYRAHGAFSAPGYAMKSLCDALDALEKDLERESADILVENRRALDAADAALAALAPQRTLERGFALIKTEGGAIGSISGLEVGKRAKIVMRDGEADVTVENIKAGGSQ